MFWVELAPSALFFIPESPRYLVAAGETGKARAVLAKLSHPDDAAEKVREIEDTLRIGHKPRLRDLWDASSGRIHPIVWVGAGLSMFQQMVGINVVFYYGATLWEAAGFSSGDALLINVVSGAVNIGSTFVAIALVDKLGRKPLLVFGSIGMTLFLAALAAVFASAHVSAEGRLQLQPAAGVAALLAANLYLFCFAVSWGPVVWVMLGEMFQNKFRGAALSVSGFAQWMANFAVTMTFPLLLKQFGLGGAYSAYAFFAFISIFFVRKLVRETKGKTLEQM